MDEVTAHAHQATIGVLADRGSDFTTETWQPLAKYLQSTIPGYEFNIVPLMLDDIKVRVAAKSLDFVLTHAASYSELESEFGAQRIATLQWRNGASTYSRFGAVIFTRKDHATIQTLEDLRGTRFMAVHPNGFGGWWMARWELQAAGIDPDDFKKLSFSGFPQDDVVQAVREGIADAGTVRSGLLEFMAAKGMINLEDFRVLNPQPKDEYPLLRSTRLYPEWAFAMLGHTHNDLARTVTVALLSAPEIPVNALAGQGVSWTVPLDYSSVHELMRDLGVGPYRHQSEGTWGDYLAAAWHWLLAIFIGGLIAVGLVLFIRHLLHRLIEAQQAALDDRARLASLEQLAVRGTLGFEQHLEHVLRVGRQLLGADYGMVVRAHLSAGMWEILAAEGTRAPTIDGTMQRGLAQTVTGAICRADKPVALARITPDLWQRFPASPAIHGQALLGSSFWSNGQVAGTLEFYWNEPRERPLTKADEGLIHVLAYCISLADARRTARASAALAEAATVPGRLRLDVADGSPSPPAEPPLARSQDTRSQK